MTSFSDLLLPAGFLVHGLNAALASLVACGIAIFLSRRSTWSLPVRHALLVVALVLSLLAPLVISLLQVPSPWAIRVSQTLDQASPSIASRPIESAPREEFREPSIAMPIPLAEQTAEPSTTAEPGASEPVTAVAGSNPPAQVREQPALARSEGARIIGTLVCGVWLVGIAFGVTRALGRLAKLRRWRKTLTLAESPLLAAAARRAAECLRLNQKVSIHRSSLLPAPVTFGLFRPRIVVPTDIESSLSGDQLCAVMQHEVAHIARRDLWIGLLQQVAQIVHWWNPLVYLANRQLADLREQICDDIAIRELPEPGAYAATLINIAERCSQCLPVPATLGIGTSPARQLENRIRRIVSSPRATCIRLSRRAAVGVSAAAVLMAATILFAQVQVKSPAIPQLSDKAQTVPARQPDEKPKAVQSQPPAKPGAVQDPTLHDLIQQITAYERMYFPFDIKAMETFRFPDDLTPQERAKNLRADGRKHQRLMEYAQLERRIWRRKETSLVDGEIEQGPYEQFSDGERITQVSPSPTIIDGVKTLEYHVNNRKNDIFNYQHATPLCGIFCLSSFGNGELFSQAFQDEDGLELAWDKGDAKLTFGFGKPHWNQKFVLWLSRDHAWHPVRLQRYWDAKDELFHDEWEVTKFVQRGKDWRVAEGTHRYRDRDAKLPDAKISYAMDFEVLAEKYGSAVNEKQFQIEIPAGAKVHDDKQPEAEPPPPANTREIKVTVVDIADRPIPGASIRIPASRIRDLDVVTTGENGVARSAKAPAGNATVQITAPGFRPVTWIMGNVNELRAIMVPLSPGLAVDEQGKTVADAWITNESLQIRADGFTYVPARDWDGRDKDWSGAEGQFELKTSLTLRRLDDVVPYIAVNQDRDKMAIRFVPASELGRQQELNLQPLCHVQGHCLLKGMTEVVGVDNGLETSTGQYIGFLSTRRELTPEGLRVDFQLRLPAGAYVLKSRASSHHAGFEIPFTVASGQKELDLGTKEVSPAGAIALKGKPAPKLEVQWRAEQQTTWNELRGNVVVLDFWGTWCGPCVAAMPTLMETHDQFRDRPVRWISIHTPNLKTFDEFDGQVAKVQDNAWNKRKLPFTAVIDSPVADQEYSGQTSQRFGVAEWPTLIVIDQKGNVVGPIPLKKLADTIERLLDEGTGK